MSLWRSQLSSASWLHWSDPISYWSFPPCRGWHNNCRTALVLWQGRCIFPSFKPWEGSLYKAVDLWEVWGHQPSWQCIQLDESVLCTCLECGCSCFCSEDIRISDNHTWYVEMTGVVMIFRLRAINGVKAFLFRIPKGPSESALIVE